MLDTEIVTCRDCGSSFDRAAQNYYDDLCPGCVDEERTWPLCWECSEPVDPEEGESIGITNRRGRRAGEADYVAVHEGECAESVRSRLRGPVP